MGLRTAGGLEETGGKRNKIYFFFKYLSGSHVANTFIFINLQSHTLPLFENASRILTMIMMNFMVQKRELEF